MRQTADERRKAMDERLARAIASQFSCRLMSNAKWRKTFRILGDPALGLTKFTYRVVERDGDLDSDLRRNARPPRDEVEALCWLDRLPRPGQLREWGTADCLTGGPQNYRDIEWIELPARYVGPAAPEAGRERQVVHQDIAAAARALSSAGKFPIELTDERLRLYGYR